MHKNPNEDRVLDHIREIPGMERMAVVHGKPPAEGSYGIRVSTIRHKRRRCSGNLTSAPACDIRKLSV